MYFFYCEQTEIEIERKRKAIKISGYYVRIVKLNIHGIVKPIITRVLGTDAKRVKREKQVNK